MEQCAIIKNGRDIVKVSNFKRKYKKLISNPEITILEECTPELLEERYDYWVDKYAPKSNVGEDIEDERYYFVNDKTGQTIISIYPELGDYIKDRNDYRRIDKNDYRRVNRIS